MTRSLAYAHSSRAGSDEGLLTVRRARPADATALGTLAALDSARALTGDSLVAELDGRMVAAVSLHDGRAIADPFERTADVVEILRVQAAAGRTDRRRLSRWLPRAPRLAPRPA